MLEEILIAGFGGQGIVFAGRLLSEAALAEGKEVALSVSYGPEMRGGTANAAVILSDEPIGSLVVSHPTVAIMMNQLSMARFEPNVKAGGLLIVNQSLVPYRSRRDDITSIYVPATELALRLGDKTVANLIMVGTLMAIRPLIAINTLDQVMSRILAAEHPGQLEMNRRALQLGTEFSDTLKPVSAGSGGE